MKFKNKLLGLVLGLAVTLGVGYGLANNQDLTRVTSAADELVYTLDGTTTGGTNDYATESDITQNEITWKVTGNTHQNPWRIGGKSLIGVDRTVYNTTQMAFNIEKVEIDIGTASSINVNSTKFSVFSSLTDLTNRTNAIEEIDLTFEANKTLTATKTSAAEWKNAFYLLNFNVTISTSNKNQYLQLKAIKFYEVSSLDPHVQITSSTTELEVGKTFTFVAQANNAEGATISWTSSAPAVGTIDSTTGLFTALNEGKTTIRASMTYNGIDYFKEVEVNVVPTEKEYRAAKYPVVGSTYLIGYVNGETKGYYDGTMSSYYANVTDKPSKGIQITIEKEADGYLLKTSDGKYVGVVVSGTHYNFKYNDSKLYSSYILSAGTFKWTFDSTECFLAYSKTYKTGGGYVWSKLSNTDYCPLRLFEEVTVTEKTDKDVVNFFVEDYLFKNTIPTSEIGTGKCKTDGWYILAKQEYTALSDAQKTLFVSDTDFTDMLARYNAWAVANGDTTISAGALTQSSVHKDVISDNNNQTTILILSLVAIITLSIGLYFYIRKKKLAK